LMAWHATGIVFAFVGGEHWGLLMPEQLYNSRSHRTLTEVDSGIEDSRMLTVCTEGKIGYAMWRVKQARS
jgi:hypothetical protein